MKKAPKLNPYANLQLAPTARITADPASSVATSERPYMPQVRAGRPRLGRTIRETAKAYPLYLHPAAHKALKVYAAESGRKMHDLMVEAVEEWFAKHGISQPVRPAVASPEPTG
jgi:hypothetical protein